MAVTLNASTSSGFIATSDTSGDLALQANGSTKMTIGSSITMNSGGLITSGTVQNSTSGTFIDFTGIPSWVKRITVMLSLVSTNGTSNLRVRIGPVGGVETSGYSGTSTAFASTAVGQIQLSAGVDINDGGIAATSRNGQIVFTLLDSATNNWAFSGSIGQGDTFRAAIVGGSKSLTGVLSVVRITTVNGTDTFDAGTINILYEG